MTKELQPFGNVQMTKTGLTFKESTPFEEWKGVGEFLKNAEGSIQFWIGDWLKFGERKYGEKYPKELQEITGREYKTLKDYKSVADKVELSLRNDNLTFQHHKTVSPLKAPEQKKWLAKAEKEDWSASELRQAIVKENKPETPQLPKGKYDLILADPPWRYDFSETDSRKVENQYPTMDINDICSLPMNDLTAKDCVVYVWATTAKLVEAMKVIEAWGLTYKSSMVWVKDSIGMGYWARGRHELLLIATKGNPHPPEQSKRPDSVIEAPKGKHSEKPLKVIEMLDRIYPNAEKLEMFSRNPQKGWTAWGNDVV